MYPEVEEALARSSTSLRRQLKNGCDGDWTRVTVRDGAFTIHNNELLARRARHRQGDTDYSRPSASQHREITKLAARSAQATAGYQQALDRLREHTARGSSPSKPTPAPPPQPPSPPKRHRPALQVSSSTPRADFDAHAIVAMSSATQFQMRFASGLDAAIAYSYYPEVSELVGVNFDLVDAAIRSPTWVEVRPESTTKKYPVLRFTRGDLDAILGFREPLQPMCIAVYHDSRLDSHLPTGRKSSGGGNAGARVPVNSKQLFKYLRERGAEVTEGDATATVCAVVYKGQQIGSVKVDAGRADVWAEWQRMNRRIQGVDKTTSP